jgi:hypothetical protein
MTYRIVTDFQRDIASRFNNPPAANEAAPAPGGLPRESDMPPSVPRSTGFAPDAPNKTPGYPALPNDTTR